MMRCQLDVAEEEGKIFPKGKQYVQRDLEGAWPIRETER